MGKASRRLGLRASRYYQLTHDYLVHSLAGVADPQAEGDEAGPGRTAAGGAGGAVERQAGEPPPARLVGVANIRLLTRKKDWTPSQKKMMRKAGRYHVVRGVALAVMLLALTVAGLGV